MVQIYDVSSFYPNGFLSGSNAIALCRETTVELEWSILCINENACTPKPRQLVNYLHTRAPGTGNRLLKKSSTNRDQGLMMYLFCSQRLLDQRPTDAARSR